uniref:Uncharacterized protein n=1 Tax=Cacopsylla melanoneura TaxID=428564 RepID=A0A8D8Z9D5_9HEMI
MSPSYLKQEYNRKSLLSSQESSYAIRLTGLTVNKGVFLSECIILPLIHSHFNKHCIYIQCTCSAIEYELCMRLMQMFYLFIFHRPQWLRGDTADSQSRGR